ncbi:hypothetical protein GOG43_17635 [Salmonella enterica subsp. enterica]|nr:hypothetical protein [Salmonella enterica subsp. enterica serovar Wagenia]
MELKKLDSSFYTDNPVLRQALDFDQQTGQWAEDKTRGHGIVQIELNGLVFAIPVRTYVKHNACFILEVNRDDRSVKGMGLDYSKAMLIRVPNHITNSVFLLRNKTSAKKLIGKEEHITKQFTKYVDRYIKAVSKQDRRILNNPEYRFTTLINYHRELGISD